LQDFKGTFPSYCYYATLSLQSSTVIIMKLFSSSVILVFCALSCVGAERGFRNRLSTTSDSLPAAPKANKLRNLQKKGGKKDCTGVVTGIITSCEAFITTPGRYVLEDDLKCAANETGIIVDGAFDVNIDCQGHTIRADKEAPGFFGIGVGGRSSDITIANCKVRRFFNGLLGDISGFDDLTVRSSSFKQNFVGMNLFGSSSFPSATIFDSKFDENVEGILADDTDTTYISSSASNNEFSGVFLFDINRQASVTFLDVMTNDNGSAGIFTPQNSTISVISSKACGNGALDLDLDFTVTTQENTCDTSFPLETLAGIPVCECPCKGGKSSGSKQAAAAGNTGTVDIAATTTPLTKEEVLEQMKAQYRGNDVSAASTYFGSRL
jgi:hypothetical protein